eukprot:PhM_4_TR2882/c0_g1_i1/m.44407
MSSSSSSPKQSPSMVVLGDTVDSLIPPPPPTHPMSPSNPISFATQWSLRDTPTRSAVVRAACCIEGLLSRLRQARYRFRHRVRHFLEGVVTIQKAWRAYVWRRNDLLQRTLVMSLNSNNNNKGVMRGGAAARGLWHRRQSVVSPQTAKEAIAHRLERKLSYLVECYYLPMPDYVPKEACAAETPEVEMMNGNDPIDVILQMECIMQCYLETQNVFRQTMRNARRLGHVDVHLPFVFEIKDIDELGLRYAAMAKVEVYKRAHAALLNYHNPQDDLVEARRFFTSMSSSSSGSFGLDDGGLMVSREYSFAALPHSVEGHACRVPWTNDLTSFFAYRMSRSCALQSAVQLAHATGPRPSALRRPTATPPKRGSLDMAASGDDDDDSTPEPTPPPSPRPGPVVSMTVSLREAAAPETWNTCHKKGEQTHREVTTTTEWRGDRVITRTVVHTQVRALYESAVGAVPSEKKRTQQEKRHGHHHNASKREEPVVSKLSTPLCTPRLGGGANGKSNNNSNCVNMEELTRVVSKQTRRDVHDARLTPLPKSAYAIREPARPKSALAGRPPPVKHKKMTTTKTEEVNKVEAEDGLRVVEKNPQNHSTTFVLNTTTRVAPSFDVVRAHRPRTAARRWFRNEPRRTPQPYLLRSGVAPSSGYYPNNNYNHNNNGDLFDLSIFDDYEEERDDDERDSVSTATPRPTTAAAKKSLTTMDETTTSVVEEVDPDNDNDGSGRERRKSAFGNYQHLGTFLAKLQQPERSNNSSSGAEENLRHLDAVRVVRDYKPQSREMRRLRALMSFSL